MRRCRNRFIYDKYCVVLPPSLNPKTLNPKPPVLSALLTEAASNSKPAGAASRSGGGVARDAPEDSAGSGFWNSGLGV